MNWSLQPELLNTSFIGGLNHLQAKEYVTIQSCKAAMSQTQFWMYGYAVLFLIAWVAFCYLLYKSFKKV